MRKNALTPNPFVRILSFFLCLIIMFSITPTVIFAEAAHAIDGVVNSTDNSYGVDNDVYSYISDAFELEELREENVKHFRLEDGTCIAVQYDYPVHYIDESGAMQDINNQLTPSSGGVFANENSRIQFAKKITGNETLFTLHDSNTKLTFSLSGAIEGVSGTVSNYDDSNAKTTLQKMINLEKLTSSIIYKNILSGVDLEYIVRSNNIKENIIVKEKSDAYTYSFELKLNGLYAELSSNGDVFVWNEKNNTLQYTIPAPVVYDSNNEFAASGISYYKLENLNGGKYNLIVEVSSDWMNDENRVFPVTVDPNINAYRSNFVDTSISYSSPNSSFGNEEFLYVNDYRMAHWKTTVLPVIPESAYITRASIVLAAPSTSGYYVAAHEVVTDWDSSLTWNQYTDPVNPKGKIDSKVIDYQLVNVEYPEWNITELVEKWYSGENYGVAFAKFSELPCDMEFNSSDFYYFEEVPRLIIRYRDMKGTEPYWSYSSHSAGIAGTGSINLANGRLTLAIPTLSTTDSLMPYTPTLVYNSSISNKDYVYPNAETANTYSYMPYGFKLNICETVVKKTYMDERETTYYYYVYSDADGTEHGFYLSGGSVYVDEDGMQKTLTVQSDGSVAITDDTKWTRIFTKKASAPSNTVGAWYLSKIIDESGNQIIFTFDSSLRPTKVSMKPNGLAQIDFLELYYYSTGKLRMIYNQASKDAVVFRYSSTYSGAISTTSTNYLRQIDYAHGNSSVTLTNWESFATTASNKTNITLDASAQYEYNSSGNITYAIDTRSNQKFYYYWNGKKIQALSHFGNQTLGQGLSYIYGVGYTDVKSSGNDDILDTLDDIITRYVFDDHGRSKSVYSYAKDGTEIYGATVGKYETQANIKNNLKEQTVISGSSVNYLLNGNFEETTSQSSFNHWQISGAVTRTTQYIDGDGEYSATFDPVSGASASITQYVSLKAGEYTLSMPYITQRADNISGVVTVSSISGSGFSHSEKISLNPNYNNGIKNIFSTSFTVPDYISGGDRLSITIKFTAGASVTSAPRIEIDKVMLENNIGASNFSLVSYGSFDASSLNSSGAITPLSSYWKTEANTAPTVVSAETLFENSVKVTAQIGTSKYVKQRIYQILDSELGLYDYQNSEFRSNANNEYIVSGFALAEDAVYSSNAVFRIRVDVVYYQGAGISDVTKSHYFDFVPSCTGWQFTGGSFSTKYEKPYYDNNDYSCVKAIDVYCEYSNQANGYALFDNISVLNSTGTDVEKYYYYSSGTENGLLSRKENRFYIEYYEYDDNRNLSRVANNLGEITDYYYTSANKVDYTIDYDFLWGASKNYPYAYANPDAQITKTPKTKTDYTYDSYGLTTVIETYQIDANLNKLSGSKRLYNRYVYETTSGSKIFGSLIWEYDGLDVDIRYYYDESNGRLLAAVNCDENTGICYSYDEMGNLVSVRPATYSSNTIYSPVTNAENVSYTYNSNNLLNTIATRSTTYTFSYDLFGNVSSIKAGDNVVSSYSYNSRNGKLNKVTYSNGFFVEYVYNDLELLSEIWYTDNVGTQKAYEYEYTSNGLVYKFIDNINAKSTVYKYDTNNRLVSFIEYENDDLYHNFSSEIFYDDQGLLSGIYYDVNHQNGMAFDASEWSYSYSYNESSQLLDSLKISTLCTLGREYFCYDSYDRVYQKIYSAYLVEDLAERFENQIDYTFKEYTLSAATSNWVNTYTSTVNDGTSLTYTFTYDQNGNITKIAFSTGEEIRYVYDDVGQLIREDNTLLNSTDVYTYDNAGNLLSKKYYSLTAAGATPQTLYYTYNYSYSSSDWGDLLTSFDGHTITYDEIGNPLAYYNGASYSFAWTGRELTGATKTGDVYSFTYNDSGIRTSKTKNGVTTTYYLDGSQIVAEETNGNLTVYLYDAAGLPLGMQYHGGDYDRDQWTAYWFEKNIFGDIVAVYSENGTKLISYEYDAYGRWWSTQHNGGYSTPAYNNPFRYRGYYYDRDLGLYYLNSRYYDSYTGRFVNADSALYHDILGYNMYTYCYNNPVNYVDYSGESAGAIATFLGSLWGAAFLEPTPLGEIAAGVVTIGVGVAIGFGIVELGELIDSASQANKGEFLVAPPQSIIEQIYKADKNYHEDNEKANFPVDKKTPPTEEDGFYHKGDKPTIGKTKDGKHKGWVDKNGNIWVPAPTGSKNAHGGGHWDVQRPDGKGYVNVYPGGKIRPGEGKIPIFKR